MHTKQKGNIAFSAVIYILHKNGFNVFSEIGDYSKVDLIAEKNGVFKKIQVKYCEEVNGAIKVPIRKSGPNGYRYTYTKTDIDWFAAYNPKTSNVYWIKASIACKRKSAFTIREKNTKNNQVKNVNLSSEYDIKSFLEEYG